MVNRGCLLVVMVLAAALSVQAGEVIFVPLKIDGPAHDPARNSYWFGPFCECASVLDFDGDGDLDIAAGRNWYEAPDWTRHADFRDGAETNGPETDDNSEFAMDVNFDGRMDIVSSGWMFLKGAFWYENPGKKDVVWKSTRIHQAINMEGVIHGDIDGDGDDDILCNHWALVKGQGMTWLEHIDKAPWFVEHVVGTQGDVHGNGLGDINGDGRVDIVTQVGWYEQPPRASDTPWTFHADYEFKADKGLGGPASHPIIVYDVDQDGRNDIVIAGKGGLYVFYNQGNPPTPPRLHKLPPEEVYPTWRDWPAYDVLFNSRDLTGWTVPEGDNGHWKVVDGEIDYDAQSEAKGDKNLWTQKSFGDFALHVEWRFKQTSGLYPMRTILPDGSYKTDANGKVIETPTPASCFAGRAGDRSTCGAGPSARGKCGPSATIRA